MTGLVAGTYPAMTAAAGVIERALGEAGADGSVSVESWARREAAAVLGVEPRTRNHWLDAITELRARVRAVPFKDGAGYVCPHCGPDPRGPETHHLDQHTVGSIEDEEAAVARATDRMAELREPDPNTGDAHPSPFREPSPVCNWAYPEPSGCTNRPEFEAWPEARPGGDPYDHTQACADHLGHLLGVIAGTPQAFSWTVHAIPHEEPLRESGDEYVGAQLVGTSPADPTKKARKYVRELAWVGVDQRTDGSDWQYVGIEEPAELLTDEERALVDDLGALMGKFRALATDPAPQLANDQLEVLLHVHALQNIVLAQAGCRAYGYRLFGESKQWQGSPTLEPVVEAATRSVRGEGVES